MPQNNLKIASFYSSPFGVTLQEREFTSEKYRYGFNGMEKDDELKGKGNSVNFTYRMYDPRLGKFLSIDPVAKKFPFWSPYVFCGNQVIKTSELEGKETEAESVNTVEIVASTIYRQGSKGMDIAKVDPSSAYSPLYIISTDRQAQTFAEIVGGAYAGPHTYNGGMDGTYCTVYVFKTTKLGETVQEILKEKHGITEIDDDRLQGLLTFKWDSPTDDRSDLFYYEVPSVVLNNLTPYAITLPMVRVGVMPPGAITPTSSVFVDIDALASQIADDYVAQEQFFNTMEAVIKITNDIFNITANLLTGNISYFSKVARGNQKQGDFEHLSDEEVDEAYKNLSKKGKLSKEEKKQKQKLKTEQKARGTRNKQKNKSEKGEGTGR